MVAASRQTILRLINASQRTICPCHSCSPVHDHGHGALSSLSQLRRYATPIKTVQKVRTQINAYKTGLTHCYRIQEYAFEVAASNLRFGEGVTAEVGMDFKNMKARKIGVFTDPNVAKLTAMKVVCDTPYHLMRWL